MVPTPEPVPRGQYRFRSGIGVARPLSVRGTPRRGMTTVSLKFWISMLPGGVACPKAVRSGMAAVYRYPLQLDNRMDVFRKMQPYLICHNAFLSALVFIQAD